MIGWKAKSSDPRVASARIRCLNPVGELQRRGFPVELFRPDHLARYNAVVYSKLYDPANYREALELQSRGVRIIVDLCDNHFYNPAGVAELERAGSQLRQMLGLADHLVASTPAMAEVMLAEVGVDRSITVIGDAVEKEIVGGREPALSRWRGAYDLRRLRTWLGRPDGGTALVWFGIHGGPHHEHGMSDLGRIRSTLEKLHREHGVSLTVISNSRRKYAALVAPWSLPTRYLEWKPTTFLAALRAHHIAVIPITRNAFTACKSNNRLATALMAGLPVVADSIPSYEEFRTFCRLDDWEGGLSHYITDIGARSLDVAAGRALVERDYSPTHIADLWQRLLQPYSSRD